MTPFKFLFATATLMATSLEAEIKPLGAGAEYDGIVLPKESEMGATNRLATRVVVHEAKVIKPVSPLLLGYNHDGPSSISVFFKDGALSEDRMASTAGMNIPMPLNRVQVFGYFENTRWKACLGPTEDRPVLKWYQWDKGSKKPYGPVEAVKLCQRFDPAARFVWVVNPWDSGEDTSDLVEFLLGDGTKPRGPTNWAQKRKDMGISAPVPVDIWEIGNEVDWANPPKRMAVSEYIERSRRIIEAIRRVSPSAKIALHGATAPWAYQQRFQEDWKNWHRDILAQLATEIDYISLHPYYSGYPISYVETVLDVVRDDIATSQGAGRVKIYISEHATWPGDIGKRETWFQVLTLSAALSVSHFLSRLLTRPEVSAATFHCFTHGGGLWGLVDIGKNSQNRYPTVFAHLFKTIRDGMGDTVVGTEVSGEKTDVRGDGERNLFSAVAMTTSQGLSLLLVNREPSAPRAIDFAFIGKYTLVKETRFTAPYMKSHNTEWVTNSFVTESPRAEANFRTYEMAPKSMVILQLLRE